MPQSVAGRMEQKAAYGEEERKKERKKGKRDGVYRGRKRGGDNLIVLPELSAYASFLLLVYKDIRKDKTRRVISGGPPISPRDGKSASGMLPWQLRG